MEKKIMILGKKKAKQIIPGFGLLLGITLSMLSLIVLIPFASMIIFASKLTFAEFVGVITSDLVLAGYKVSFGCALVAAIINGIFGTLLAWVLVRYEFPGKKIFDGLIELPFALPTAVAGIALTALYSDQGWIGSIFASVGIPIAYTRTGIIIAMIFVGIPFVVRSIQPVLEKLDKQYEEAAAILGASGGTIFFKVILPEIFPAMLTGLGLAFARGVGEYGSVIFIAGNIPYETQIAPLLIVAKLEQLKYTDATAIALVMLAISLLVLLAINLIQLVAAKKTA